MASVQVSVKAASTGVITYFGTYAAARSTASSGDLIQIWADLDEQIILKNGVDIEIISGRILDMTSALPTLIDNGVSCNCRIFGQGIIKNSYDTTSTRYECIKLTHSGSKVYIECDFLEGTGKKDSSIGGATINVVDSTSFTLICNNIINKNNSAIVISACDDLFIKCKKIESGSETAGNTGAPVISIAATGTIISDELICYGYGNCLLHKDGQLTCKLLKISTRDAETETSAPPTILLDDGTGEQELILYFDEIQNLNSSSGDCVTIEEGNAILIGRRIYSPNGLSLNLGANANIKCSEIISDTKGVNIHNEAPQKVTIYADLIEGSTGNYGVIYSVGATLYEIQNAKIKNKSTSGSVPYSIGIYVDNADAQNITLQNVILVTGNTTNGQTIYTPPLAPETSTIYNYGIFLNKAVSSTFLWVVGDSNNDNYKYIVDVLVS